MTRRRTIAPSVIVLCSSKVNDTCVCCWVAMPRRAIGLPCRRIYWVIWQAARGRGQGRKCRAHPGRPCVGGARLKGPGSAIRAIARPRQACNAHKGSEPLARRGRGMRAPERQSTERWHGAGSARTTGMDAPAVGLGCTCHAAAARANSIPKHRTPSGSSGWATCSHGVPGRARLSS